MNLKTSLRQRIVFVFTLMSTVVAGVFAVGIIFTVHFVETRLTTVSLSGSLHRLMKMESMDAWSHRPDRDELFYVENGTGSLAMAEDLNSLDLGFQEISRQGHDYYAVVDAVDGRRYVLLRDQRRFEKREQLLFSVVLVGFILSVLLSILLGRMLATRVIAPVVRLSRQVQDRDQILSFAPPLASDYVRDEVGELASSFDETLGRLRSALNREKLFTSDVSHELRTPLMVLGTSCELLLENAALDDRSREQVRRIARACTGMEQLVETFLMLARVDSVKARHGARASINTVANELLHIWKKPIADKKLNLIFIPESDSQQTFNATLLHSVMGNLLRNAWHYTDSGFIKLTTFEGGFTVEDSGIGIPVEKQRSMFQPFVRGDHQRGEGLGLGLSLVQRICVNQSWRVTLSHRIPNGCCFRIDLDPQSVKDTHILLPEV